MRGHTRLVRASSCKAPRTELAKPLQAACSPGEKLPLPICSESLLPQLSTLPPSEQPGSIFSMTTSQAWEGSFSLPHGQIWLQGQHCPPQSTELRFLPVQGLRVGLPRAMPIHHGVPCGRAHACVPWESRESEHLTASSPGALGDTGCRCPQRAGLRSGALDRIEIANLVYVQKFMQLPPSSVTLDAEELGDIWLCRQREIRKNSPHKKFQPSFAFLT